MLLNKPNSLPLQPKLPLWLSLNLTERQKVLDVLTQLGVKNLEHNGLEIFPSEEHTASAEEFWRNHGVVASDKLIGWQKVTQ